MTSTAASVGPYKLCTAVPVNSRNRCAGFGANASPEENTNRSEPHRAAPEPADTPGSAATNTVN
ncbi:hypothetical protein, partial [Nocardia rhamnosiphila]|uniref:hypothetical protein n=1 Tax=Nocardia rhamnosiphila TaxID=426716 RepID=UPI003CD0C8AF